MKIIFAGTPDAALPTLTSLLADDRHEVVAVLTRPDAPSGRKKLLTPSPVAKLAEERGLRVLKASRLDADLREQIRQLEPDVGIVVAYGVLFSAEDLALPKHGWLNLHFSVLPRWRGAAPIQRAIHAGEQEVGISIFKLDEGLDTGPVLVSRKVALFADETSGEALERLAVIGSRLLVEELARDDLSYSRFSKQPEISPTPPASKFSRAEAQIIWTMPAEKIRSLIKATNPEPGAWTTLNNETIRIHRVSEPKSRPEIKLQAGFPPDLLRDKSPSDDIDDEPGLNPGAIIFLKKSAWVCCGDDRLVELLELQPAGKRVMLAAEWVNGQQSVAARFSQVTN